MLKHYYKQDLLVAGLDEAGRGCLAGPVYAAAVILPRNYKNKVLNDSKQLTGKERYELRPEIEGIALSWAVGMVDNAEIDEINILNASILAMHRALEKLDKDPQWLLVDGNRFKPFRGIPYDCIVKGDAKYFSIAAASVLAKTYRDDFMVKIAANHPEYNWAANKGYPTRDHKDAINAYGITPYHRKSFNLNEQLKMNF